jgi:hypothetical protein
VIALLNLHHDIFGQGVLDSSRLRTPRLGGHLGSIRAKPSDPLKGAPGVLFESFDKRLDFGGSERRWLGDYRGNDAEQKKTIE